MTEENTSNNIYWIPEKNVSGAKNVENISHWSAIQIQKLTVVLKETEFAADLDNLFSH